MAAAGFEINPVPAWPSSAAVDVLRELPSSQLSDVLAGHRSTGVLRLYALPSARLCGPAFTVRVPVADQLLVQKALDMAPPGAVIVVDAGAYLDTAIAGEIMTRYAMSRGLGGFVIDGAIRDVDFIGTQPFPIYARGASPRGPNRLGPGEINPILQIGTMTVAPGDIICGDLDGLASVPAEKAFEVAQGVRSLAEKEVAALAAIASKTLDRSWIDQALIARGYMPSPTK